VSEIRTVAVIGAGTMGHGIAQVAAQAGCTVRLADALPGAAVRALQRVRTNLDGALTRGKLTETDRDAVMGRLVAAETAAAAALRELSEETGLVTDAASLRDMGTIAPEPGVLEARVRLFAAEDCIGGRAAPGAEMGHSEVKYFTRQELGGLIQGGEVMDPCTLVCCYKYLGLPG